MDFDSLLKALGAIGASAGSAYASWKWIWPWLKNDLWPVLKGFRAIADLPQVVSTCGDLQKGVHATSTQLGRVMKEVLPNGGSSLRDAVTRIEASSTETGNTVRILSATMRARDDGDPTRALFETDGFGTNLWVNKTYLRWINRSAAEVMGWGWLAVLHPEDAPRVRAEWINAVEERRQFQSRYRLVSSNGESFEVECHASPVPEGGATVERYVGVIRRVDRRYLEDDIA